MKPPPDSVQQLAAYASKADAMRAAMPAADCDWQVRNDFLQEYGDACRFAGRIEESLKTFTDMLREADAHQDPIGQAHARVGIANAYSARSRWNDATLALLPAIENAERSRQPVLRARMQCVLASVHFNKGSLQQAADLLQDALRTAREYEATEVEVPASISLGIVSLACGDLAAAHAKLSSGTLLAQQAGNTHWLLLGRSYLAIQAQLAGQLDQAANLYEQSIAELTSIGLRRARGVSRFAHATLWMVRGNWESARQTIGQSLSELAVTCPDYEPLLFASLALCDLGEGSPASFRQQISHASSLVTASTPPTFAAIVRHVAATLDEQMAEALPSEALPSIEGQLIAQVLRSIHHVGAATLVLDSEASRARVSGLAEVIDLSRRATLQRLLQSMVEQHLSSPGVYLSDDKLIRTLWPGERITEKAARVRLHTAVSTLRTKGLARWIERSPQGYRLRPDLRVRKVPFGAVDLFGDV